MPLLMSHTRAVLTGSPSKLAAETTGSSALVPVASPLRESLAPVPTTTRRLSGLKARAKQALRRWFCG